MLAGTKLKPGSRNRVYCASVASTQMSMSFNTSLPAAVPRMATTDRLAGAKWNSKNDDAV